jgi:hypothetical protein
MNDTIVALAAIVFTSGMSVFAGLLVLSAREDRRFRAELARRHQRLFERR